MKTAEQILETHYSGYEKRIAYPEQVIDAMQEYAQKEAIKFGKWVREVGSINGHGSLNTEELYKIWTNERRT